MNRQEMASRIADRVRAVKWTNNLDLAGHAIIDSLLPEETARAAFSGFPGQAEGFTVLDSFRERKRTSVDLERLSPILADITYAIQSPEVVEAVSDLTGIDDLKPDPSLLRGGVSMMMRGDFLNPHLDNSHGPQGAGYRRLNLLYYVTPEWRPECGGNLELWEPRVRHPLTIDALFNRLVIMSTDRRSWHSVSPVIAERTRCCVSNYFFTDASPETAEYYQVTSFTGRPGQLGRRALGLVDNAARQFVKTRLGVNRARNRGCEPAMSSLPMQMPHAGQPGSLRPG